MTGPTAGFNLKKLDYEAKWRKGKAKNIYDIWQYILHENTHTPETTDGLMKKWSNPLVSKACKLKPCNTVSNHQTGKNWNNSNTQETQGNKNIYKTI